MTGQGQAKQVKRVEGITWLPDEDYQKAVGQLRMQVGGVLEPFRAYGMDVFIPGAITEIVRLCEDFGLRVRGVDKVISLDKVRGK